MVRVGNAHHSLVIYILKKLKIYYYPKIRKQSQWQSQLQ